jgi:hypothetical protein
MSQPATPSQAQPPSHPAFLSTGHTAVGQVLHLRHHYHYHHMSTPPTPHPHPHPARPAGASLEMHQPTVARMQEHYTKRGVELNSARLRMATLPAPAEVLFTEGCWVPLVNLQSVYILPGIPRLFQAMISAHQVGGRAVEHMAASTMAAACSRKLAAVSQHSRSQHAACVAG